MSSTETGITKDNLSAMVRNGRVTTMEQYRVPGSQTDTRFSTERAITPNDIGSLIHINEQGAKNHAGFVFDVNDPEGNQANGLGYVTLATEQPETKGKRPSFKERWFTANGFLARAIDMDRILSYRLELQDHQIKGLRKWQ